MYKNWSLKAKLLDLEKNKVEEDFATEAHASQGFDARRFFRDFLISQNRINIK